MVCSVSAVLMADHVTWVIALQCTHCPATHGLTVLVLIICSLASDGKLWWDDPSKVGTWDAANGWYRSESRGWRNMVKHFDLHRRNYLKNDDLIIFVDFEGELIDKLNCEPCLICLS